MCHVPEQRENTVLCRAAAPGSVVSPQLAHSSWLQVGENRAGWRGGELEIQGAEGPEEAQAAGWHLEKAP